MKPSLIKGNIDRDAYTGGTLCELESKDQNDASPKWSVPQTASRLPEARPQSI